MRFNRSTVHLREFTVRTRGLAVAVVVVLLAAVMATTPDRAAAEEVETSDTIRVVKDNDAASNSELAVRMSEATPLPTGGTVVMGRSDVYADSLASGVLQDESSLLLVPPQGPVPDRVLAELARLAPTRIILLGGPNAIGTVVEDSLSGSYQVERRAGPSRIETAIEIAQTDAPGADTAILARAFSSAGASDETQAFADALGAGGLAAEMGWPVLLTQTETLTGSTRDYLARSNISRIHLVGGTAAISAGVEAELNQMQITTERVAGSSRAQTALEVAKLRGANSADDVPRVTLVEGQAEDAWAGGFAAAAHSALFDAPIVLTSGATVPPETLSFLQGEASFAVPTTDLEQPVLTCVAAPAACETSRVTLGLPAAVAVTFDPPSATTLTPSQEVRITVSQSQTTGSGFGQASDEPAAGEVRVAGTCLDQPTSAPLEDGTVTVMVSASPPAVCTVTASLVLSNGSVQTSTATYPGGVISGTVRDATTAEPVANATVRLSSGESVVAGADGTFAFADRPSGADTVTAAIEGYQESAPVPVLVSAGQTSTVDVLLSPAFTGALRIVLTWDDDPQDLDSHLWLPAARPFHLYYGNPGTLTGCPNAELDIDDTSGMGPETITIGQDVGGTYRYAVHRFGGAETLSQSQAVVQVYGETGEIATFEVPLNGTQAEEWWHVFDIDLTTGTITAVNRLVQAELDVAPYTEQTSCP